MSLKVVNMSFTTPVFNLILDVILLISELTVLAAGCCGGVLKLLSIKVMLLYYDMFISYYYIFISQVL